MFSYPNIGYKNVQCLKENRKTNCLFNKFQKRNRKGNITNTSCKVDLHVTYIPH